MNNSFTAIDFEKAQGYRWSICQIGLIQVTNGVITDEINLLVKPPDNYYWPRFIDIHGITPLDTANSPTFDQIWHKVEPFITNKNVVAHNGLSFDFPVLQKTLEYYDLQVPEYSKFDTYRIHKAGLAELCKAYKIPLNHHDALSDAKACAELFLIHLNSKN
ncbi:MAG: 3'-5' exonuclease [Bacteroidales bacterium]|nr:3'-5' exonuclease [Bacteroidales bacterium]MBN2758846.1 3'-5' exonuclease [Bacteroidales bacterium]